MRIFTLISALSLAFVMTGCGPAVMKNLSTVDQVDSRELTNITQNKEVTAKTELNLSDKASDNFYFWRGYYPFYRYYSPYYYGYYRYPYYRYYGYGYPYYGIGFGYPYVIRKTVRIYKRPMN